MWVEQFRFSSTRWVSVRVFLFALFGTLGFVTSINPRGQVSRYLRDCLQEKVSRAEKPRVASILSRCFGCFVQGTRKGHFHLSKTPSWFVQRCTNCGVMATLDTGYFSQALNVDDEDASYNVRKCSRRLSIDKRTLLWQVSPYRIVASSRLLFPYSWRNVLLPVSHPVQRYRHLGGTLQRHGPAGRYRHSFSMQQRNKISLTTTGRPEAVLDIVMEIHYTGLDKCK